MPVVAPGTAVESKGRRPFDPSEEADLEVALDARLARPRDS